MASNSLRLALFILVSLPHVESEILTAFAVCRHGERNARFTFPGDPYAESDWVGGYGALTKLGSDHQFFLGYRLHSLFTNGTHLPVDKVYYRSSEADRCMQSARSNSHGFMGQPDVVEIHTVPHKTDRLLNPDAPCQLYYDVWAQIEHSKLYEDLKEKYAPLFAELIRHGISTGLQDTWMLFDSLNAMKATGKEWPIWCTPEVFKILDEMNAKLENLRSGFGLPDDLESFGQNFSVLIPRIRGGKLLWEIIDRMKNAVKCDQGDQDRCGFKFHAYSAHDATLMALLSTLKSPFSVLNGGVPDYNDCITFELTKDQGQYNVMAQYSHFEPQNISSIILYHMGPLNSCRTCHLDAFADSHEAFKPPEDFEEWCSRGLKQYTNPEVDENSKEGNSEKSPNESTTSTWYLIGVVMPVLLVFLVHEN